MLDMSDMEYVRENGKWKISYMNWMERMGLPGAECVKHYWTTLTGY
jgi:hypothetical protein